MHTKTINSKEASSCAGSMPDPMALCQNVDVLANDHFLSIILFRSPAMPALDLSVLVPVEVTPGVVLNSLTLINNISRNFGYRANRQSFGQNPFQ